MDGRIGGAAVIFGILSCGGGGGGSFGRDMLVVRRLQPYFRHASAPDLAEGRKEGRTEGKEEREHDRVKKEEEGED